MPKTSSCSCRAFAIEDSKEPDKATNSCSCPAMTFNPDSICAFLARSLFMKFTVSIMDCALSHIFSKRALAALYCSDRRNLSFSIDKSFPTALRTTCRLKTSSFNPERRLSNCPTSSFNSTYLLNRFIKPSHKSYFPNRQRLPLVSSEPSSASMLCKRNKLPSNSFFFFSKDLNQFNFAESLSASASRRTASFSFSLILHDTLILSSSDKTAILPICASSSAMHL